VDPRTDKLKPFFFDNTDPDGMDRVLATIGSDLDKTLCIIISKSGGTKETRNGMLVAENAFKLAGLHFGQHAVAITTHGSELDKHAVKNKWLTQFPMWDWVGGRTSELSPVGLLPAALQGIDINSLISGACKCDAATRIANVKANPAAQLSLLGTSQVTVKEAKTWSFYPIKTVWSCFQSTFKQTRDGIARERT